MEEMLEGKVQGFLDFLVREKNCSENTIAAYRNDLNQFTSFIKERGGVSTWADVDRNLIVNYYLYLKEREYAISTVARKIAAIKSFFHFLVKQGFLKDDPTATLDSPRVQRRPPKTLTPDEVARLLAIPASQTHRKAIRDKAMLELLYATGLRVSELVNLNLEDLDLEKGQVQCTRRGKKRTIPLSPRALEAITDYLEKARPQLVKATSEEKALFVNNRGERLSRQGLWLIIKQYVEQAGLPSDVAPYTLRHSFAVHRLRQGETLHRLQELLGHVNPATTQVYARMTEAKPPSPEESETGLKEEA